MLSCTCVTARATEARAHCSLAKSKSEPAWREAYAGKTNQDMQDFFVEFCWGLHGDVSCHGLLGPILPFAHFDASKLKKGQQRPRQYPYRMPPQVHE